MLEDTLLAFSLPSVRRKKVTAAFDGGRMTSDGGVMLLAAIETSLGKTIGDRYEASITAITDINDMTGRERTRHILDSLEPVS